MSNEKKGNKVQIWVAIIGLTGVLIASIIGNWDKITSSATTKKADTSNTTIQNLSGNNSNIINNNSGEVNVNN